ncbi:MAG: hypothetical protein ACREA0_28620, partial [bacterium]
RSGNPTIYDGDDHDQNCSARGGFDDMRGYGGNDTLNAGGGKDWAKGATGSDSLNDAAGNGDADDQCDGNGLDSLNVGDGDGNDICWFVLYDTYGDTCLRNQNDYLGAYQPNQCPVGGS